MNRRLTINLDPINDGFTGDYEKAASTAGRYVVIGTNYEHKTISKRQFDEKTTELSEKNRLGLFMIYDYVIYYDTSKLMDIDGNLYLIGSFFLVKMAEDGPDAYEWLGSEDIEEAKEDIAGHFTEVIIDGEFYEALLVD